MKTLSHANSKKKEKGEEKKAYGFQISHFYWSFSSDITAMKGLTDVLSYLNLPPSTLDYVIFKVEPRLHKSFDTGYFSNTD